MKDYSYKVKTIIQNMINAQDDAHYFLNTAIIRPLVIDALDVEYEDETARDISRIGVDQLMERWLYSFGYYSIGRGRFVNLDYCDERALDLIIENSESDVESRQKALKRKRDYADGRGKFLINGNIISGWIFSMTQEEYDAYVDKHTVGM